MTKLSPKSEVLDAPPKVESFQSSNQQANIKSVNRSSIVSSTLQENSKGVPLMVNASKNLFDAVDKEFKEQPT